MKSFSIQEAIQFGWARFKSHLLFLWAVLGVLWGISLILSVFDGMAQKGTQTSALFSLLSFIIGIVLQLGAIRIYLSLVDNDKEEKLETLISEYRLFFHYLGAAILYGLMVMLGLLAFIVPGVYFILKYQFFSYLIVDKRMGAFDALKQSAVLTEGVKWKLLGFSFVLIGLNLLGLLVFVIGLMVSVPVSILASAFVYRTLSKRLLPVSAEPIPAVAEAEALSEAPLILPSSNTEAH